jgi:hypothetical protein
VATLAEQLLLNSQSTLKRVEIYSPQVEEEETVIQEENTDPTPE